MEVIKRWQILNNRLLAALERQLRKPWWLLRATLLAWALATFFCCPSAYEMLHGDWWHTQQAAIQKIENPLRDMSDYPPESTQSKRTFRITVPLIAHVLHLNIIGVYVLQWIFGFVLLVVTLIMVERWFQDRLTAFLATLCLAAIYPGSAAFLEYWNLFDAFAYLFLILSIYFSAPMLIFPLILAAAFTDERALIASPTIILFHAIQGAPKGLPVRPRALLNSQTWAVIAAWVFYFGIRSALATAYHLPTVSTGVGLKTLLQFRQLHVIHLGLWGAFEAAWIFFPLALTALWIKRERWLLVLWICSICVSLMTAISVQDITRSASYLIGSLFLSWLILSRSSNLPNDLRALRQLFAGIAVVCLLMLDYRVFGTPSTPLPLPAEVAKTIYLLRNPNSGNADQSDYPYVRTTNGIPSQSYP